VTATNPRTAGPDRGPASCLVQVVLGDLQVIAATASMVPSHLAPSTNSTLTGSSRGRALEGRARTGSGARPRAAPAGALAGRPAGRSRRRDRSGSGVRRRQWRVGQGTPGVGDDAAAEGAGAGEHRRHAVDPAGELFPQHGGAHLGADRGQGLLLGLEAQPGLELGLQLIEHPPHGRLGRLVRFLRLEDSRQPSARPVCPQLRLGSLSSVRAARKQ
jgi:hypothetical protein